jgi:hypothetical protein
MKVLGKNNILDLAKVVNQKKIKQLERSDKYTTYFQNKAICLGENIKTAQRLNVSQPEVDLRTEYYHSIDRYYHKNKSQYHITVLTEKSVQFWRKVNENREKAGVDAHTYIKAQFAWFHQHFGCVPSLPSLLTENAVKRAVEFVASKNRSNIVSSVIDHKSELADVLRSTDEMIRRIMKAHNLTKEDFYKNLVLTGEFSVSKIYLDSDPVYKKVKGKK